MSMDISKCCEILEVSAMATTTTTTTTTVVAFHASSSSRRCRRTSCFPITRHRRHSCAAAAAPRLDGSDEHNGGADAAAAAAADDDDDAAGDVEDTRSGRRQGRKEKGALRTSMNDHYSVLGIRRNADQVAVKVAFRKLARKYHPDVNNDFGAAEDFKRIRSAYETLSDTGSRCAYDQALRMKSHARRDSTRNDRYSSVYKGGSQQMYSRHARHKDWEKNNYGHIWKFYQKRSSDETNPKTTRIEYESDPDVMQESSPLFVARDGSATELLIIFTLVGFIWYTFGVQLALTYFAFFIPHNNDHTILYKFSSLLAWLIGGSKGIFLQYGIVTTGWLYGKDHDIVLAFLLSGLWIANNFPHAFHIPRGAILLMAYLALGTKGPSS